MNRWDRKPSIGDVLAIAAVPHTGLWGYVILFLAVAASWIGIPLVGAGVLATAGVLASEGALNLWWVILVATAGAWIGGYVGYLLGQAAADALAVKSGRWHSRWRRMLRAGLRVHRRWGPLVVLTTPTYVSGAMHIERRAFLVWNGLAALSSNLVAALGAYGIGAAVLGRLSAFDAAWALAGIAVVAAGLAILFAARRHRRRSHGTAAATGARGHR